MALPIPKALRRFPGYHSNKWREGVRVWPKVKFINNVHLEWGGGGRVLSRGT